MYFRKSPLLITQCVLTLYSINLTTLYLLICLHFLIILIWHYLIRLIFVYPPLLLPTELILSFTGLILNLLTHGTRKTFSLVLFSTPIYVNFLRTPHRSYTLFALPGHMYLIGARLLWEYRYISPIHSASLFTYFQNPYLFATIFSTLDG